MDHGDEAPCTLPRILSNIDILARTH